jgi:hypothetical protein
MPHEGAGVGEVCMANEECAGMLCLAAEAGAAQGLCTQFCNLTAELGRCGVSRDSTDPATGGCDVVTSREVSGMPLNVGDMGLCAATCEIDEGCPLPGWTCAELLEEAAEVVGHSGLCVFSYLLAAPDAGAP